MTNDNFDIRIATTADNILLCEIGRYTFYETWRPVNTEEDMLSYMAEAFALEKIKKDLADAGNTFLLATYADETVGYVKLRTGRTYDEFKGARAIELERIYIKHQHHGKKWGKALMDKCIDIARNGKYEWLWLGVNTENHKAINFYKQYGFTIFGTKSFTLGAADDDDYLMKLKLIYEY